MKAEKSAAKGRVAVKNGGGRGQEVRNDSTTLPTAGDGLGDVVAN